MYHFHPASGEQSVIHEYGNDEFRLMVHVQEHGLMITAIRLGESLQSCQFVTIAGDLVEIANGVAGLPGPELVRPNDVVSGAPLLVLFPPGKPFDVPVIRFSDERWTVPGQGHKGYLLQALEVAQWPLAEDLNEVAKRIQG